MDAEANAVTLPDATPDESLWQTIKGDLFAGDGLRLVGVAALLVWMGFQWGFGNDALLPSIVATTFDAIDDGDSWAAGVTAVAAASLAAFVFWGVTQAIDAVVVLAGLRLVPGITQRIARFLRRKGWVTPYREMKWSTRWVIAYATGVSVLCLVDLFATGETGIARRRRMIAMGTVLSAGSVAVVVAMVVAAAMVATRVPATEDGAEWFIRFAKNPLTWIVIFGAVFAIGHVRSNLRRPTAT